MYRADDDEKYESCLQYDLSGVGSISSNFDSAMSQRPQSLPKISCEKPGVAMSDSWEYDTTEGIRSIVTDVRTNAMTNENRQQIIVPFLSISVGSCLRAAAPSLHSPGQLHGRSLCGVHRVRLGLR